VDLEAEVESVQERTLTLTAVASAEGTTLATARGTFVRQA
jgi:hypothetical protein